MTVRPRQPKPRSQAANRWEAWQAKPPCTRWLPWHVRQEGYTVLRVSPHLRTAFLDIAQVFLRYDALFQKHQRGLPPHLLTCFQRWAEATQALVKALQEEGARDSSLPGV